MMFCITLCFFTYYGFFSLDYDESYALVEIDGKAVLSISLLNDGEYKVGESDIILKVEKREIFVKSTSCPDKVCKNTGRIGKGNEVIVCVPNKMTVRIVNKEKAVLDGIVS